MLYYTRALQCLTFIVNEQSEPEVNPEDEFPESFTGLSDLLSQAPDSYLQDRKDTLSPVLNTYSFHGNVCTAVYLFIRIFGAEMFVSLLVSNYHMRLNQGSPKTITQKNKQKKKKRHNTQQNNELQPAVRHNCEKMIKFEIKRRG